jgi:prepilin-type N-terminal cleavage/methylation domain-containing protein
MNRSSRLRRGFSLVEVMIALALAGTVALLAHRLFGVVLEGSRQLAIEARALDREQNAGRVLSSMLLSTAVGTDGDTPFQGHADRVRFSAWMETEDGWFERREIALWLAEGRLQATISPGASLVLGDSVQALELDYLLELGAATRWVAEWISPVTAPLAVRVRTRRQPLRGSARSDTTIYLIKARG